MKRIDGLFLRLAVAYLFAGMLLGIFMGMSDDHSQMPTHAHINLLGTLLLAIIVYTRIGPAQVSGRAEQLSTAD